MFGFVIASLPSLSDEEKERYHEVYCGLCRALKTRYGNVSRATLSYDLTFYILLASSLQEPPETHEEGHCPAHPKKLQRSSRNRYSDYAADLTLSLAYHKCLDDWNDERKMRARMGEKLLAGAYEKAKERIPDQCRSIEESLARISELEQSPMTESDDAARAFGKMLGVLFGFDQGIWKSPMTEFGDYLGRFVYLMDAAVDFEDDVKTGNYNPFVRLETPPDQMRAILSHYIANASRVFEKLPLEQDLHLMRSVLYEGVWQRFNEKYNNDEMNEKHKKNEKTGATRKRAMQRARS